MNDSVPNTLRPKIKRTDSELLDGLEKLVSIGDCPGIINDDKGHWAVSATGMQTIQAGPGPDDVQTVFYIEAARWKATIREAIEAYLNEAETELNAPNNGEQQS